MKLMIVMNCYKYVFKLNDLNQLYLCYLSLIKTDYSLTETRSKRRVAVFLLSHELNNKQISCYVMGVLKLCLRFWKVGMTVTVSIKFINYR